VILCLTKTRKRRPWAERTVGKILGSLIIVLAGLAACSSHEEPTGPPTLGWYVFQEPSGAFEEAARRCSAAQGAYRIRIVPLPADADQQREQLARRLAASDSSIDLIGMDVIWTAEFAEAGWILPWPDTLAANATVGRFPAALRTARYKNRQWASPFTANVQLLWYRTDRVPVPPRTWDEMIDRAEALGARIQIQGERYEGLTVFFASLLASAGGRILEDGERVALEPEPTREVLALMRRLAASPAADPALSTAREDQTRLAFEAGGSAFMVNYPFVWPSARGNAPEIAARMGWARWPAVTPDRPSRVVIGGTHLAVAAYSRHPEQAFRAAACLAGEGSQRLAAERGGLPPTLEPLYDEAAIRRAFPFADLLRDTLRDAAERPQTPLYNDLSLAISRTLHPLQALEPQRDAERLRTAVERALRSEGLL
jgi:multiple sugar transport system substrate-binding protein